MVGGVIAMPPVARLHRLCKAIRACISQRSGDLAAAVLVLTVGIAMQARAADLPRVASINVCTDQLLMTLADPAQIVGLSPYAQDAARSWAATEARKYRRLSGEAEDVLTLKPDLVVAGLYMKRATRELLKQQGMRIAEFDIARSIEDVKEQIRRMGGLVGHADRAEAQVARLDAAIARARQAVARKPYRVLALSRRGWVSGDDSITSALLSITGLSNAASGLGSNSSGFASLEAIVADRPDFILISDGRDVAEDEGSALLLHPALEKLYPPSRRLIIPEDLTVCGGPMLSDALDQLVAELKRVGG
jgi:iron complex transport system substrate-binding protein